MTRTVLVALAMLACTPKNTTPAPATDPTASNPATTTTGETTPAAPAEVPPTASEQAATGKGNKGTTTGGNIEQRIGDAAALLAVGRPDTAQRAYDILKNVLADAPNNAIAYYDLGVAQNQMGNPAGARLSFENAIEKDPKLARAWLALGALQEQSNTYDRAADNYLNGIMQAPNDMELHTALVGALRKAKKLDEAIKAAKDALAINAKSLAVYNELGLVYLDKNDLAMAHFVYLKARQDPAATQNAAMRCNYGVTLARQGQAAYAKYELEEAYKLDRMYLPTLVTLSRIYIDDRNYTDALPMLEVATQKVPDDHGVLMNLAVSYRGVGRYDDAKRIYQKALAIDPSNPDPWMNMGILLGDYQKNYDEAIAAYNKYLAMGGTDGAKVQGYIDALQKERVRAEKMKGAEAERLKREQEKAERERLIKEGGGQAPPPPGDSPWGGGNQ